VRPAELHSRSAEENCTTENVSSLRSVKVATPPCAAKAAIPCGLAVRKQHNCCSPPASLKANKMNFMEQANRNLTKECDCMKKLITLVLALVCVLGLVGCNQKAVSASEVYSFPEPTTMITVSFYSQGEETAFEIGSEEYDSNDLSTTPVINWFYDLKLTACDEPEAVEGSESYEFYVKGESAFTYEDRGSEAYIIIGGSYYKVSNPSAPPIN